MGPSLQTERTRKSILLGNEGSKPCAGLLLWGPSSFGPSWLRPASRDRPLAIARAGPNAMPHRPMPSRPVAANRAATASTTPGTAIARKGPAGIILVQGGTGAFLHRCTPCATQDGCGVALGVRLPPTAACGCQGSGMALSCRAAVTWIIQIRFRFRGGTADKQTIDLPGGWDTLCPISG